jgi:hypothetical protein
LEKYIRLIFLPHFTTTTYGLYHSRYGFWQVHFGHLILYMYGSDFPFTPANQIRHNLNDLLQMLEKESLIAYKKKILFENAQDLFQI